MASTMPTLHKLAEVAHFLWSFRIDGSVITRGNSNSMGYALKEIWSNGETRRGFNKTRSNDEARQLVLLNAIVVQIFSHV